MFKRIMQKAGRHFFDACPTLQRMLSNLFKERPITAAFVALYVLPVRKFLKLSRYSDDERIKTYTFTISREYYNELQDLLHIEKAENFSLVRMGRDNDGGYIMLDDLPGGIAYSFGIARDVSWEKDIASRGYDVFMHDHTIYELPEENQRFHWSKLGISDGVTDDDRLKTLEELISRNGHENERNMILKMDVEGAEWGFLESVKPETLSQFSQIAFELHGINSPDLCTKIPEVLRKINNTHQLIHLHGLNCAFHVCNNGKIFCNQIEACYVRRDKYRFIEDYDVSLPIDIDMPTIPFIPEIKLGHWNRKAEASDQKLSLIAYTE